MTDTCDYPIAFFFHGDLADPHTLQSVLDSPHLLKLRKAWLPSYLATENSTVINSDFGFREWQEEEFRGFAYFFKSDDEENILRDYTRAVEVTDAKFKICAGGILGKRNWVVGRVFVSATTNEQEADPRETPERLEVLEERNELTTTTVTTWVKSHDILL